MTVAKHYTAPKAKAKNNEPSWFVVILLSGILSGMLLFTIGWYMSLPETQRTAVIDKLVATKDIFPGIMGLNQSKLLLVMGVDMPPLGSTDDYHAVRTDTMMLVKLDNGSKRINVVSIPRDSKVYIAGSNRVDKINAAFTYGGPESTVATVESTLGVDIDNYIVANIRGVRDFIDALGGIDIYVEKPMHYRDRTAGLNINLEPGYQHLNGVQAEGFLRFRHDALGDIGRIRRQQQFINAVSAKVKDPETLLRIKPILSASNKFVLTDMSTQDLIRLAMFAKDMDKSGVQTATLPGRPSLNSAVSYWIIDPQAAEAVLNRLIVGVNSSEELGVNEKPTVGLLYTSSHQGQVADYRAKLEAEGFDVVCRSQVRRSTTKVITHNAAATQKTSARLLETMPALSSAQLIFSPHGGTFETNSCGRSDYTIVLGEDRSASNQ